MKMSILLFGAAAVLMSTEGYYSMCYAAELPTSVASAIKSADYSAALSAVQARIGKISEGKSFRELENNAEFKDLALLEDMISSVGAEKVTALAAKDKKYARFLAKFFSDPAWMRLYSCAGLLPKGSDVGLRVMGDIWDKHGEDSDFRKFLSLTCGIGASWGAGGFANTLQAGEKLKTGNGRCDPVWRYEFFTKSWKAGKLHKNFIKLRPWEIRFVAGTKWDDASLAFLQKKINLPPNKYGDACWSATYSGMSEFGDTIQGPLYYTPWPDSMGEAERTVRHGGVCGALSHVGMTAAAAHGIPSYPCGQPGHCAYAFRLERGKWQGGFGGPDGGPHNYIFPGEAPTSVNLMEAAFADDKKVSTAYSARACALALEECGNVPAAKSAWEAALSATPHNYYMQEEFRKFIKSKNLFSAEDWKKYAEGIIKLYEGHGFAAEKVIAPIENEFLSSMTDSEKIIWFSKVQNCIAGTKTSWATKLIPIIEAESKKLKAESGEEFLRMLLSTHLSRGNGENFGQLLEWAVKNYVAAGKDKMFAEAFSHAAGDSGAGGIDKDKMKQAYSKAMLAAEAARSSEAFQAIGKKAIQAGFGKGYDGPGKLDLPAGKLVSDSGYLRISSTSPWDNPCAHYNVLREADGAFHTNTDEKAYAIVELPKSVPISGILIVKNRGNEWRTKKMKVFRSVDGATWFEIASSDNTPTQWKILFQDAPQAKWIKVENAANGKEIMHLRNILIFSK